MWPVILPTVLAAALTAVGVWLSPRWTTSKRRLPFEYAIATGLGAVLGGLLGQELALLYPVDATGVLVAAMAGAVFLAVLITASLIDFRDRIIPNELMLASAICGLVFAFLPGLQGWSDALIGAGVGFGVLLLLAIVFRGGMGMGDVKLAGVMGLFLGWPEVATALMVAFLVGGVVSLLLLVLRVVRRKDHIPFGPFLAAGGAVALVWGRSLLVWWLG